MPGWWRLMYPPAADVAGAAPLDQAEKRALIGEMGSRSANFVLG